MIYEHGISTISEFTRHRSSSVYAHHIYHPGIESAQLRHTIIICSPSKLYCAGIVVTVKQRQEFRIRLQKRARRTAEKKLESYEVERQARTVSRLDTNIETIISINFSGSYISLPSDTELCVFTVSVASSNGVIWHSVTEINSIV